MVAVKKKGHADIYMNDGSRVRLAAGSRLEIGALDDEKGVSMQFSTPSSSIAPPTTPVSGRQSGVPITVASRCRPALS